MRPNLIRQLLFSASVAVLSGQSPGTFTATGNLIAAEGYPFATLLSNGKVLITGNSAELYDPASGSFSPTGPIDSRIFNSCTLLADGRVLIAGGAVGVAGVPLASAEIYDPSTGIFTPTGTMTTPRQGHNAVLLNTGKVFIAETTEVARCRYSRRTLRSRLRDVCCHRFLPWSGRRNGHRHFTRGRQGSDRHLL